MLYEVITSQIFLMTDKTAYNSRSFTDAFEARNYKIIENSNQKEKVSFSDGLTFIDQVINSDEVRCPGNILSTRITSYNVCYTKLLRYMIEKLIYLESVNLIEFLGVKNIKLEILRNKFPKLRIISYNFV